MNNYSRNDLDTVIICPYDESHKIAKSRFQKHLVKCEKNYPPNYKLCCPYDATHRVFEHEMKQHINSCPMKFEIDGVSLEDDKESNEHDERSSNVNPYRIVPSIRGALMASRYRTASQPQRLVQVSRTQFKNTEDIGDNDSDEDIELVTGIGRGKALTRLR